MGKNLEQGTDKIFSKIIQGAKWCMPPVSGGDSLEANRLAKLVISFTLALICLALFYSLFYAWLYDYLVPAIYIASSLIAVGNLLFLRRTGNTAISANILTGLFFFALYSSNIILGGRHFPGVIWHIAVIPVAFALTGRRCGIIWTAGNIAAIISFYIPHSPGASFFIELSPELFTLLNLFIYTSVCIFIAVSFYMFEAFKDNMIHIHKETVEKITEREQMLTTILAASPIGIAMIEDGNIGWGNSALSFMLGWLPEEYEGRSARFLFKYSDEYMYIGAALNHKASAPKTIDVDARLVRKDGDIFDGYVSILPVDPERPEKGSIMAIMDITERKQGETVLRESEEKYRLLMETVPDAIVISEFSTGRFLHVNESFSKITSYTREEALGKTPLELNLIVNLKDDRFLRTIIKENGEINDFETQYRQKDGTTVDMLVSARLLHYIDEYLDVTVAKDITGRKQAENEIRELNLQLEKRVIDERAKLQSAREEIIRKEHKSELADITSATLHNVKNILNSVKISTESIGEIISSGSINSLRKANDILGEQVENLEEFICNNDKGKKLMHYYLKLGDSFDTEEKESRIHLNRLLAKVDAIEKIVTAQQGYSGKLEKEIVDITHVVEDALTMLANSIEGYHIQIVKDFSHVTEVRVLKTKLMHILINLIKNAIEAMNEIPADKRVLRISTEQTANGVCLKINDKGCGIQEEDIHKMFRYGFTTKEDGHGFGLASCAAYLEEMDGEISVESEGNGKGSTFTMTLMALDC